MDQAGGDENPHNRKRTRDQGEDDYESKKGKGSEFSVLDDLMHKEKSYDFADGVGVFDFPWLKEGVIYKGNEYFGEPEDTFAPCSYIDAEVSSTFASNLDQSSPQNSPVPPGHDQNLHDKKTDDDSLRSLFPFDDLEPVDCIWSFAIDQPLDVGLNKARVEI
ncbi:hypothetical protein F511_01400 [Dorcoceras hygrometricum]|uniref:Uncharacterized protein n=1 Tax=Dorcoceras hygrometricum TaxID=472368 RepID=A0A2Z7BHH4_9LAMI|nr:hypothetical protein F511_01400 [Dorcoceras hygrometricum]